MCTLSCRLLSSTISSPNEAFFGLAGSNTIIFRHRHRAEERVPYLPFPIYQCIAPLAQNLVPFVPVLTHGEAWGSAPYFFLQSIRRHDANFAKHSGRLVAGEPDRNTPC